MKNIQNNMMQSRQQTKTLTSIQDQLSCIPQMLHNGKIFRYKGGAKFTVGCYAPQMDSQIYTIPRSGKNISTLS